VTKYQKIVNNVSKGLSSEVSEIVISSFQEITIFWKFRVLVLAAVNMLNGCQKTQL